ncbi:hypothetical protein WME95_14630 [Sorangium sp. So ce327]|uniref:hypothetical protein n=1 Tax=Sorangium sp. So ce327 TaxID=3133301 RepID=UPI003F6282BF
MISVAVKSEMVCGTCRMPMPVNTLAREVGCPSCGRPAALGVDLWQALLRDPLYNGPRLLPNEVRRSAAGKLSAAYIRRAPACQGCEKAIPVSSIQAVVDQAMLRCDRCAVQTWVRRVPPELAGALPDITHLVGEEPDRLAGAPAPQAEPATFPCPQCGSPVAFDGVSRACVCRFCSASVHVPDEFVYRGRRRVVAHWYLCFAPSVVVRTPAAQAVAAGLFDWEGLPEAAVDADGNLYCAATQSRWYLDQAGRTQHKIDRVLWSMDPSLGIRWLQRDRSEEVRFLGCAKDTLLVIDAGGVPLRLSSATGAPLDSAGAVAPSIELSLAEQGCLTCDHDGSLLLHKDGKLQRIGADGAAMPVWTNGATRSDTGEDSYWSLTSLADHPVTLSSMASTSIHSGPDGSLYLLDGNLLARFERGGRKVYCVEIGGGSADRQRGALGADRDGNAYVIRGDRLVRVGATGNESVILHVERDALPRADMSIAVCPDGSFWLFGKEGLAWKFDPRGKLLFASEKEPRPKNPSMDEVFQQHVENVMEMANVRANACQEDLLRVHGELTRREKASKSFINKISWVLTILLILAFFAYENCS